MPHPRDRLHERLDARFDRARHNPVPWQGVDTAVTSVQQCSTLARAAIRQSAVEQFCVARTVDQYVDVYCDEIAAAGPEVDGRTP